MIYNILVIIISIVIAILFFKKIYKDEFSIKNLWIAIECVILIIGCCVRLVAIDKFPIGLNCDEASSSYDAYAILHNGIDRNGNFLPVFLEAWGSGQNALYSYLMMPFIALFGLNLITTRLPMAIIGCISLMIWYCLLKTIKKDRKFVLIGFSFLCICPWHIMKSRWGLESNVFPDLVLWAVYLIIKALQTDKIYKTYIASIILGIAGYAYGTAYFFLPIFYVFLFGYLIWKKEISIKNAMICLAIIFIVDLPIMIYVVINTFGFEQINLPFMTIPKLPVNRYEEQTTLFSGNILMNAIENIKNSIGLLFLQNDKLAWNCIPNFGIYYIISVPFLLVGLIFCFKNSKLRNREDVIINIWFIVAFLLLFVFKDANINRINIVIFPLVYYIVRGLYLVFAIDKKVVNIALIIIYFVNFVWFSVSYVNMKIVEYWTFTDGIEDMVEYVDSQNAEKIYFEYVFKEPYIYVLYYTKSDVHKFVDTVQYFEGEANFENVKGFGKYCFYLPEAFDEENCLYVVKKNSDLEIDYDEFEIKEFDQYLVLKGK